MINRNYSEKFVKFIVNISKHMKINSLITGLVLLICTTSCNSNEIEKLKEQNKQLKVELNNSNEINDSLINVLNSEFYSIITRSSDEKLTSPNSYEFMVTLSMNRLNFIKKVYGKAVFSERDFDYSINNPSELIELKDSLESASSLDYDYGHYIFKNDSLKTKPYGFVGIFEFQDKGVYRMVSFGHKFIR
jgi:hypothetical protein